MAKAPNLTDFDPVIRDNGQGGILLFNCPNCNGQDEQHQPHRIRVPLAPQSVGHFWDHTGDFTNMTLSNKKNPDNPEGLSSVNAGCWHGHLTNGELRECGVAYD